MNSEAFDPSREADPEGSGFDSDLPPKHRDLYQRYRAKMRGLLSQIGPGFKHADILLVAPDLLHVLIRLAADRRVRPAQKAKLMATIAYFVIPIGLVPEALVGPIGYIDDVALAAYVLSSMLNSDEAPIVREHWAGEGNVLDVVKGILDVAESAIRGGLWRNLKGFRFRK